MDFVPLAAAAALVWKVVDLTKYARARNVSAVTSQLATWAAGVAVTLLLAASDYGAGVEVGGIVLGDANAAAIVLLGLTLGASASVTYDFKKALDGTDSAATPSLLPLHRG